MLAAQSRDYQYGAAPPTGWLTFDIIPEPYLPRPWNATRRDDPAVLEGRRARNAEFIRDIFGNPFRPVPFSPSWLTSTVVAIARGMYEGRDFSAMPILADALQDAGCDHTAILDHCRSECPHVRGCWVVDLLLGKS
ncbi:MAG TPA: hypothetical protein VKE74_32225 [Gemmataceae bacterium]|nr:hypothetical protein [Gemmataceae bacterium]